MIPPLLFTWVKRSGGMGDRVSERADMLSSSYVQAVFGVDRGEGKIVPQENMSILLYFVS